ncbi:MAG TPA: hypothetical protein VG013_06925 [Gemmataceae bacterium]|jgi:hypothetical protein|nr:hypothetical protein [Gemmataceae bacterium]
MRRIVLTALALIALALPAHARGVRAVRPHTVHVRQPPGVRPRPIHTVRPPRLPRHR